MDPDLEDIQDYEGKSRSELVTLLRHQDRRIREFEEKIKNLNELNLEKEGAIQQMKSNYLQQLTAAKEDKLRAVRNATDEIQRSKSLLEEELKNIKEGETATAFNPAIFLKDSIREKFWEMIIKNQHFSAEKYELLNQIETLKTNSKIEQKRSEIQINELIKQVEELRGYKDEHFAGSQVIQQLHKDLLRKEENYEKFHLQKYSLEKENEILKDLVSTYEKRITEVEDFYRKSRRDYEMQREELKKKVEKLDTRQSKKTGLIRIAGEFRATEIFYSKNTEYNLDQLILRFKTVSPDGSKFVQMLDLISDFFSLVISEKKMIEEKSLLSKVDRAEVQKMEHLHNSLMKDDICETAIKGLHQPSNANFLKTINFFLSLGESYIESKIKIFEDPALVNKLSMMVKNDQMKEHRIDIFRLFGLLVTHSQIFIKKFLDIGGVQFLFGEMMDTQDPIFINSSFYTNIVLLLRNLLARSHGLDLLEFVNGDFLLFLIKLLEECYNKETLYHILGILYELSLNNILRKNLTDLQIFSRLASFYEDAYNTKNTKLLFHMFLIFSSFTKDVSFKVQFYSSLENENDFSSLFEPFKHENNLEATHVVKLAVLEIIANVILNGPSKKMRRSIAKANYLKTMLKNCLEDGNDRLKEQSLDTLISLFDLIQEGVFSIDDLIIDFDKLFSTETDRVLEKMFLFVSWGLLSNNLSINFITKNFVIKVMESGLKSLLEKNHRLFHRCNFVIYLILERENWENVILSLQYYERLITIKVPETLLCKKTWLEAICIMMLHPSFGVALKSNPELLQFISIEMISKAVTLNPSVMILLMQAKKSLTIEFDGIINNADFWTSILEGFIASLSVYSRRPSLLYVALEVLYRYCREDATKQAILRNIDFHKFISVCLEKGANDINRFTLRIIHSLSDRATEEQFKGIFKSDEMKQGIRKLSQQTEDLDIISLLKEIGAHVETLGILPKKEITGKVGSAPAIQPLEPDFNSRKILIENDIYRLMEDFLKEFRLRSNSY